MIYKINVYSIQIIFMKCYAKKYSLYVRQKRAYKAKKYNNHGRANKAYIENNQKTLPKLFYSEKLLYWNKLHAQC